MEERISVCIDEVFSSVISLVNDRKLLPSTFWCKNVRINAIVSSSNAEHHENVEAISEMKCNIPEEDDLKRNELKTNNTTTLSNNSSTNEQEINPLVDVHKSILGHNDNSKHKTRNRKINYKSSRWLKEQEESVVQSTMLVRKLKQEKAARDKKKRQQLDAEAEILIHESIINEKKRKEATELEALEKTIKLKARLEKAAAERAERWVKINSLKRENKTKMKSKRSTHRTTTSSSTDSSYTSLTTTKNQHRRNKYNEGDVLVIGKPSSGMESKLHHNIISPHNATQQEQQSASKTRQDKRNKNPPKKSKFYFEMKRRDKEKQLKISEAAASKLALIEKQKHYGKYVKSKHTPSRSRFSGHNNNNNNNNDNDLQCKEHVKSSGKYRTNDRLPSLVVPNKYHGAPSKHAKTIISESPSRGNEEIMLKPSPRKPYKAVNEREYNNNNNNSNNNNNNNSGGVGGVHIHRTTTAEKVKGSHPLKSRIPVMKASRRPPTVVAGVTTATSSSKASTTPYDAYQKVKNIFNNKNNTMSSPFSNTTSGGSGDKYPSSRNEFYERIMRETTPPSNSDTEATMSAVIGYRQDDIITMNTSPASEPPEFDYLNAIKTKMKSIQL